MSDRIEYTISKRDFDFVRELVFERAGISLSDKKRELVLGRLSRRARKLGAANLEDYCDGLRDGNEDEIAELINVITTNTTSFFRQPFHFERLANEILPELMKARETTRELRIWSSACSSGQEPYTIAMILKEMIKDSAGWKIRLLATDIDHDTLARAKAGVYSQDVMEEIPKERLRRWFFKGRGDQEGKMLVRPELKEMVTFRHLNLMQPWPMKHAFDIVFCRNVIIYFNKETQRLLFERMADAMADDGYLFLGQSESLFSVTDRFELVSQALYRRSR